MSAKVAVVTGASSGVGRAVGIALAREGWQVALLARRSDALSQTVALAPAEAGARMHPMVCDIAQKSAVDAVAAKVLQQFGRVDALVNAAGTNIPDRALALMTDDNYRDVFDTNLTGALSCVRALLPAMRAQKSGVVVNINSIAGQNASVLSGAAYVMSKFALRGLTQTINLEEGPKGIRAISIFPGDINTEILEKRAAPPPPEARQKMLHPEDVAACVMLAINLPDRAVIEELRITPRSV